MGRKRRFVGDDGWLRQLRNRYNYLPADRVPHFSNHTFDLIGYLPEAPTMAYCMAMGGVQPKLSLPPFGNGAGFTLLSAQTPTVAHSALRAGLAMRQFGLHPNGGDFIPAAEETGLPQRPITGWQWENFPGINQDHDK